MRRLSRPAEHQVSLEFARAGVPAEAQRLLAAASSKHKQLRIFTQAEGGAAHVNLDRPEPALSLLCDWMSDRLQRS